MPYSSGWVSFSRTLRFTQATPGLPGNPTTGAKLGASLLVGIFLSINDVLVMGMPHTRTGRGGVIRIPPDGGVLRPSPKRAILDGRPHTLLGSSLA